MLVTYPGLRMGNYLYFALHAWKEVLKGRDYRVLDTGLDAYWYEHFPALRDLMVDRIRTFDRREHIPPLFYQEYGEDFDESDISGFAASILRLPTPALFDSDTVTVNVRRGDYYESAARRDELGFDVPDYLKRALTRAGAEREIKSCRVVSDDLEWAARAVACARPGLPISELVIGPPIDHFIALARSARLVLANSSFSYWGAYVSTVLHAPRQISVYAPDLSTRAKLGGRAWQLAPWWKTVPTRRARDHDNDYTVREA